MNSRTLRIVAFLLLVFAAFALSGCSMLFGRNNAEEPAAEVVADAPALVPTFTPTAEGQAPTPTATLVFAAAGGDTGAQAAVAPAAAAATNTPAPSPTPRAILTVSQEGINVRTGPGTNFGTAGTAALGQTFDIISKNEAGDWWQVCCIDGEPGWIFSQLATVQNAENVQVGENLAAAPVAAAPVAAAPVAAAPAATAAPAAPAAPAATNTPAPAAPAAPPANDPCAGIGGDGCKWKLRGGPAFSPNGELRLTLGFIHSGVDGGQPQGSYFVVLLKDGVNLGVSDTVRSFDPSIEQRSGPHGKYNYEYKIGVDKLNGSVAGNYTIWVLDGNGERDSQDYTFTVPEGQGEVWIQFDQA